MTDLKQMLTEHIGEKRDYYPLNQSQIGIYYYCKNHPESVAYNLPSICELPKQKVALSRLLAAIKIALNNHVAFRCKIVDRSSGPVWVLTDRSFDDFEIPVEKVSEEALTEIKNRYAKPFDLFGDLLFRINIYETEKNYSIISDFHHLIYDGSSCRIWFQDIAAAYYNGTVEAEEVTMLDFCAYDDAYQKSQAEMDAISYYRDVFQGAKPRTSIPADLEENDLPGDGYCVYCFDKRIDFSKVSAVCNGRVGAFFVGAFAYAAAKYTGTGDAVVYTGNHGRMDERLRHSVGMFVRMLPVYVTIDESFSLTDYLSQVQERLYGGIKHGKCAFAALMQEHKLSIDLSILYQGDFFNHVPFGDIDCPWEALPLHGMDDDFVIMVFKEKEHFKLKVEYRKDKYKLQTVHEFLRAYEETVMTFIGETASNEGGAV